MLSTMTFAEIDPRNGKPICYQQSTDRNFDRHVFVDYGHDVYGFHPLGVVLVALLGVGVAEHTGFINASLKALLSFTSVKLLTPMLIFVAVISTLPQTRVMFW
jgi:aminobenzoyl-glutamate transport protein